MTTLNALLIGMVCAATLLVMARWHITGRGAWRNYPAGKSVMGLLGIIAAITGLATVTTLVGDFPGRSELYGVLYALLLVAVSTIGIAIISAQRERRTDMKEPPQ